MDLVSQSVMNSRYSKNVQARPEAYPEYERSNETRSGTVLDEVVEVFKIVTIAVEILTASVRSNVTVLLRCSK
jgi:hypothetical protein